MVRKSCQLRKSGAEESGETAKSAYCASWSSLRDRKSPTVNDPKRIGDREPKRLLCLWEGSGRVEASKKPISISDRPKAKPSIGAAAASGVDSNEEDEDSRVWCRRVGVWGVMDKPENCSVGRTKSVV